MPNRSFEKLEQVLHYQFKNPALLRIAMTHTSFANESKVPTHHNERLEFLGDSVLSVVVADYLFHHSSRPEGELTRMRAALVSEEALFRFAAEIDLGSYLRLGHGEELGGGRTRPSVVSDAFEALIAALYLDGGMEVVRNFILPFITEGKTADPTTRPNCRNWCRKNPAPNCGMRWWASPAPTTTRPLRCKSPSTARPWPPAKAGARRPRNSRPPSRPLPN